VGSRGATVQTFGTASAVTVVDRSARFDSLTANNVVHLDTYLEGGLRILTSGDSWAADANLSLRLDPFHIPGRTDRAFYAMAWGNEDWVTIEPTNRALMHGVELLYGNTWTTGDIFGLYPWGNDRGFVEWQTLRDGTLISSGQLGPNPTLPLGTVLGFYDPVGFDQLLVRCRIDNSSSPNLQALALDDVLVMLTNVPPAPAIYGSDLALDPTSGVPTLTVYDTVGGCDYRMVYAETPDASVWTPVRVPLPEGWQAGGGTLAFSDPAAPSNAHRFYRVQVQAR
jgi:hypothetical protein